ncbi:MAG: hypothetical protein OEM38_08775, partial [Gammaproteobacteria bacterium]|nr:hypothetical protein [Gammaproteobacteria bacterium]
VEINKAAGLYMEVSLPPQRYLITLDKQSTLFETVFTVTKNSNNTLRFDKFQRVDPVISVARGGTSTSSVAEEKMGVSELINYKLAKRKKELANNYQQIPVKLSLFPGISTPAKILNGKKDIAELELQILGSDSDNANISIGYLAATVKEDIIGGQGAGIFSHVGGNLYGGQGAGVVSVTKGNIYGGQGAGVVAISNGDLVGGMGAGILTLTKGDVNGGQGAGIASIISGNLKGGQGAGVASITTGNVIGAQAAGIVNIISGDITGFQVAGILNYTGGNLGGAQVSGLANISSGVNESAQISALNISKHAKELQLGIINIATKNDGLALSLINVIGNGRLDVGVSYDESEYSNLTIRSGAQRIYNHLSIGTKTENEISYTRLRWGIGLNKKYQNSISMDHEILVGSRFQKGDIVKNCTTCSHYSPVITLGSTLSYSIIPEIKLLAGASINILQKHTSDKSSNEQFFGRESDKVWPGALLGVEVSLQ